MRRRLIGGGVLAVLWLACGWLPYALDRAGGSAATLARLIPSAMRGGFIGSPPAWAAAMNIVGVVLLIASFTVFTGWWARSGRLGFTAGWLCAVLAGFLVGAVLDVGAISASIGVQGVRGALGRSGAAVDFVFWALLVGWLPALLVSRGARADAASGPRPRHPLLASTAVTVLAVVAAIALPLTAQGADAASQAQVRQNVAERAAQAEANADPGGAAARDPEATGAPVPTVAASAEPAAADACTRQNSTILAPGSDAATGHRLQTLRLVNTSTAPCTVSGYPDIAFADQNGHLLPVTVEHGSSFMATDPGPHAITLVSGASVEAGIGWNANSMHGQLAARTLWAAVRPGVPRTSWPVILDIIPDTTVHVTAWLTHTPTAG